MSTIYDVGAFPSKKFVYNSKPPRDAYPGTLFGVADNELVAERLKGSMAFSGFVGFSAGPFYSILFKGVDPFVMNVKNYQFITSSTVKFGFYGVFTGAMYALGVTAASKARGDKDGPLNHFVGGFAAASVPAYLRSSVKTFCMGGFYAGLFLALFKHWYMEGREFLNLVTHRPELTGHCRYPEMYIVQVDTSLLKKEAKAKALESSL